MEEVDDFLVLMHPLADKGSEQGSMFCLAFIDATEVIPRFELLESEIQLSCIRALVFSHAS